MKITTFQVILKWIKPRDVNRRTDLQVIQGNDQLFGMLAFPKENTSITNYVQNALTNIHNTFAPELANRIQQTHEFANSAMNIAKLALRHVTSLFKPDIVYSFTDMLSFQTAQPVMKRWVMANPMAADMFDNNRCEGYGGEFYSPEDFTKTRPSIDWMNVNNGVVQFTAEDAHAVTYSFDDPSNTEQLNFQDQVAVLSGWSVLEMMLSRKERDPTSPYGDAL